jgi:hypothetical protein
MNISRPNAQAPTFEEFRELERLKIRIEYAVADGKISRQDLDDTSGQIFIRKHVCAIQIYRELELYRTLVTQQIAVGNLEYDWG